MHLHCWRAEARSKFGSLRCKTPPSTSSPPWWRRASRSSAASDSRRCSASFRLSARALWSAPGRHKKHTLRRTGKRHFTTARLRSLQIKPEVCTLAIPLLWASVQQNPRALVFFEISLLRKVLEMSAILVRFGYLETLNGQRSVSQTVYLEKCSHLLTRLSSLPLANNTHENFVFTNRYN